MPPDTLHLLPKREILGRTGNGAEELKVGLAPDLDSDQSTRNTLSPQDHLDSIEESSIPLEGTRGGVELHPHPVHYPFEDRPSSQIRTSPVREFSMLVQWLTLHKE